MAKNLMDYIPKSKRHWVQNFYLDNDGYWMRLKEGYVNTHFGERVIHEKTLKGALEEFRKNVKKEVVK